jgi:acetyl-CoA synthetase
MSYYVTPEEYANLYPQSITDPAAFWQQVALTETEWMAPWQTALAGEGAAARWFVGGKLNITYDCLDRHVRDGHGDRVAYYWTNETKEVRQLTYRELLEQVSRAANALRQLGIGKGDRVVLYLPNTPEQIIAMLACARLGAIHSVVFAGFSAAALRLRLEDTGAKILITASWTQRRGKHVPLLGWARQATSGLATVEHTLVWQRDDQEPLQSGELDWDTLLNAANPVCVPEPMDSEDPLFILYTSGTTGQPKGIVHTTGGYHVYTHFTSKLVFNLHADDVYWCTADPGWITGHSYGVYGPLSNGVSSVIVEGAPDWPEPDHWWSLIDRFRVTVFYTAPTVIRLFMKYGEAYALEHDLSSLRILGSVGEPLNPEAWYWYNEHIGKNRCPIVDTWWQTETGGHMLVTLPGFTAKPGMAGLPFFGVQPQLVDEANQPVLPNQRGQLRIQQSWPSAVRDCWHNHARFEKMWSPEVGYITGDMAIRDEEGYIQILGRSDDVMNVAGHRLGTAEVENALVTHPAVAEAAAVSVPDTIKGEALAVFVTLRDGHNPTTELATELQNHVGKVIARFAVPGSVTFIDQLPKTRSGKIMRRLLRAQLLGEETGDTSTLAD